METSFDFFAILWYSYSCSKSGKTKKQVILYGKGEGNKADRPKQKSIS